MIKKQITVKDIAKKLNLHHTTVSKALRNHPDISNNTKELVLRTAKELDYRPNIIAKSFKNCRSNTIGVIVPSIGNDFFASVISGIEEVAYQKDFSIIVCQSNEDFNREIININSLISNLIAGLIVCISQTTQNGDHFKAVKKRNIPLVFFDRVFEKVKASRVVVDDYTGACIATEHLISRGYRKIAHFAGPMEISVSRNRCQGYIDTLIKHGIPIDKNIIIYGGFQEEDGIRAFQKLIEQKNIPDAIFTVNDLVAIGAYLEIEKNGLRIPDDIAIAGFGNNKLSSFINPPLTTVKQSPYDIGKLSAEIILEQILGKSDPEQIREEIITPELIIRKST